MSGFDDREKAYEDKFSHDLELDFKASARRNTLLGLWAAGEIGMTDAEADAYARSLLDTDMQYAGDSSQSGETAVRDKVFADLTAGNVETSEYLVEKKMTELLEAARTELMGGT